MTQRWKSQFLLDPSLHFLNHGSFGACPRAVFDIYQEWQRRLERQPVQFLGREITALDQAARQALGVYLNTAADNLVFVTNATHGVNIVARSLALQPGDEVLTSDHEYGACDYTWEFIGDRTGATVVRQSLPIPAASAGELAELFWRGVTSRTKVIFLSHISSPTALRLPVETICTRARAAGILTIIDGAHAPGQIDLNLDALGADFYTGNCHKWMLAPKGAAFLYARPEVQHLVQPLVVSWGYHPTPAASSGCQFVDYLSWSGTKDPAAALTVPAAIDFMHLHDWVNVRQTCHVRLRQVLQGVSDLFGLPTLYPLDSDLYGQMGAAQLPNHTNIAQVKTALIDRFGVEVPLVAWNDKKLVRISVQIYNTDEDVQALLTGLKQLLT